MYRIIGADGRDYGPVSAEQLRQWIREGRANAQTRALAEGSPHWTILGFLPEFSLLLNPAPLSAPPSGYGPARKTNSLALFGMILGILSLTLGLCCCYGLPFNLAGLVFSVVGLVQIRSQPELYEGQGLAIAGIILCLLSFLVVLGFVLFFGVAAAIGDGAHHVRRL